MGQRNDEATVSDSDKPPPDPLAQSRSAWEKASASKALSEQAIEIASEARDGVNEIRETLGQAPQPALGLPGTGLVGAVSVLLARSEAIEAKRTQRGALAKGAVAALGAIATVVGIYKAASGK